MVMKLVANGARIKELRTGGAAELPQKTLAGLCGISERQLRRLENQNAAMKLPVFERLAKELKVTVDYISFGSRGPQLVSAEKTPAVPADEPETNHIPRHTTVPLAPASAQQLYELAKHSREIVPHVLVDAGPAQMEMIEECLEILKVISDQQWSFGRPVALGAHDFTDFPEASRRRRLAELFVLIKGHDIRILAEEVLYHYPLGSAAPLEGLDFCFHLVIAFAPPRDQYEDEKVTVPYDQGRELNLPYNLKDLDKSPRCRACHSHLLEPLSGEPGVPVKLRCRSCGWIQDATERVHSKSART